MKKNIQPVNPEKKFISFTASSLHFAGFDTSGIGWYKGEDDSVVDWFDLEDYMFDYIEGHLDTEDYENYSEPTAVHISVAEIDENTYNQLREFYEFVSTKDENFELYFND